MNHSTIKWLLQHLRVKRLKKEMISLKIHMLFYTWIDDKQTDRWDSEHTTPKYGDLAY